MVEVEELAKPWFQISCKRHTTYGCMFAVIWDRKVHWVPGISVCFRKRYELSDRSPVLLLLRDPLIILQVAPFRLNCVILCFDKVSQAISPLWFDQRDNTQPTDEPQISSEKGWSGGGRQVKSHRWRTLHSFSFCLLHYFFRGSWCACRFVQFLHIYSLWTNLPEWLSCRITCNDKSSNETPMFHSHFLLLLTEQNVH